MAKVQKLAVSEVVARLGLRLSPYRNKKTGKEDPKRVCVSTAHEAAPVMFAALRALTKIKPLGAKKGQSSLRLFFPAAVMKKLVVVPSIKLSR